MSAKIADRIKTAVVVLLVTMISAVFALQFGGPQAEGCSSQGARYAARVYGHTITEGDFLAAERLIGFQRYPAELARQLKLKESLLDGLIERRLLARQASSLGLHADSDDVMQHLAQTSTVYVSLGVDSPLGVAARELQVPVQDEQGRFDKESAKRFIQYGLRRSIGEFAAAQAEETLAHDLRSVVAATAVASPLAVWQQFNDEQERVTLRYIRFAAAFFRQGKKLSEQAASQAADAAAQRALTELRNGRTLEQIAEQAVAEATTGGESADPGKPSEHTWDPQVQETESFGRADSPLTTPEDTTALVRAAFALDEKRKWPTRAVALGPDRLVFELKERRHAVKAEFDAATRRAAMSKARDERAQEIVQALTRQLRQQAEDDRAIVRNPEVLAYSATSTDE